MSPVRITWKGAGVGNYATDRGGFLPGWLVHHRMVGYLTGTDRYFQHPGLQVSTTFGIGHRRAGGPVEISQYVALDDTAYGNGNNVDAWGREVASDWNRLGYPSQPNRHSISIEHEDGARTGRGIVTEDIIEASIWLDSVLLSGDPVLVRRVGIRFRSEAIVRALGRIKVDRNHIVEHHFIAGPLKPFCWQRWMSDQGFPQARSLAALRKLAGQPAAASNLGLARVKGAWWKYVASGDTFTRTPHKTARGFSASVGEIREDASTDGRRLGRLTSGGYRGAWLDLEDAGSVVFLPKPE